MKIEKEITSSAKIKGFARFFLLFIVAGSILSSTIMMGSAAPPVDVCVAGGAQRTIHYDVAAIDVAIPVNGYGDVNPQGMMYALNNPLALPNVAQIKDPNFKLYPSTDESIPKKIQPLTLRANLGDCVEITLTNLLDTTNETVVAPATVPVNDPIGLNVINNFGNFARRNVGMQIEGLPYDPAISDGAFIGNNPDTTVGPDGTPAVNVRTYRWFANRTGGFLFRDQTNAQFPEDTMNKGLYGTLIVEEKDSAWFDSQTGRHFLKASPQIGYNLTDLVPEPAPDAKTGKPVYLGVGASIFGTVHQIPCESTTRCTHPLPKGTLLWENVSGNDYRTYALMMSDETEGLVGPIAWYENGSIAAFGRPYFPPTGLPDSTKLMNYRSEPLRNRESVWFRHRGLIPTPEVFIGGIKVQGGLVDARVQNPRTNATLGVPFVDILLPQGGVITVNGTNMTIVLPDGRTFGPNDAFCDGGNFTAVGDKNYTFYPCQGEESHLQSWPFGDVASPPPRAYWGDPAIYYASTAGTKETHTFHQHTHRWFHDPNEADVSLLPLPENNIQRSNRLDVQGIGPGEIFKMVMEQGAGSQAGTAGDSIFHCHLYPHFAEGLWSAFRVFDKLRINFTDPNNINSNMPDGTPILYPDGTQEAQLVPLPAKEALVGGLNGPRKAPPAPRGMPNRTAGIPNQTHPGYPNFIAGKFGLKSLQPPLFVIDPENVTTKTLADGSVIKAAIPIGDRATPTKLEINASYDGLSPGVTLVDPCAGPNHEFGVPDRAPNRIYQPVGIQVPLLQNGKGGFFFPEQRAYVEKELVPVVRKDPSQLKPYSWRANVGDCVEFWGKNDLQPNDTTPTLGVNDEIFHGATNTPEISNHIHIIRFDQLGTDGTSVNWNYDISARSQQTVGYRIFVDIMGRTVFNHDHQFPTSHQQGGFHAAFIVEPRNSTYQKPDGTPLGPATANPNIDSATASGKNVKGVGVAANIIVNPTTNDVNGGIGGGNVKAYREGVIHYADFVPSFVNDDPANRTALLDAFDQLKSGLLNNDPFRQDLALFDPKFRAKPFNPPSEPDFYGEDQGTSTMNYRIEPFQVRMNITSPNATMREPAYVFSSRVWGDPETQLFRAFGGDPTLIREMDGAHEDMHGFEMHGHNWKHQASDPGTFITDSQYANIGEWFNYELQGNLFINEAGKNDVNLPNGPLAAGIPGDYLFGSRPLQEMSDGVWGIFRVENGDAPDIAKLPNNPKPQVVGGLGLLGNGVNATIPIPKVNPDLINGNNPCPDGAPVKHFDIAAINQSTVYNDIYGENDPFALMYVLADQNGKPIIPENSTPLVIRANAGDCVQVKLTNNLPDLTALAAQTPVNFFNVVNKVPVLVNSPTSLDPNTLQHFGDVLVDTPKVGLRFGGTQIGQAKLEGAFVFAQWPMSRRVSMHQHLLKEVASVGDGATVGFMRDQTIGPGENITYNWFADRELGAVLLDDYGDVRSHPHHGLFATLVIEPKGSKYLDPTNLTKQINSGTSAVIQNTSTGKQFREFVTQNMDGLNLRNKTNFLITDNLGTPLPLDHQPCSPGQIFCEDVEDQGEPGVNYRTERLENRVPLVFDPISGLPSEELFNPATFTAFSSTVFQDPKTPVFEAFNGDPVVFRTLKPEDARRVQDIGLQGHAWKHEPNQPDTNFVSSEGSFGPGKAFNQYLIGGAGGLQRQPGDYLFNDRLNAPEGKHLSGGAWGLLRVLPVGTPASIKPLTSPAVLPQAQP